MRIAYFDCFSGISGDMTLAALLDAGLDMAALKKGLGGLKVKGYEIKRSRVTRNSISGTKFDCIVKGDETHGRSLKEIFSIIDKSLLSDKVKSTAKKIFTVIGDAEARVHGIDYKDVHLHELGGIDSIIDIVGTVIALEELGIDEIYSSKMNFGRSFVRTRHGMLPVPAPAVCELAKGVPVSVSEIEAELVTPTGMGILKALSKGFGRMPELEVSSVGYGAGTTELAGRPNMLRVIIGEAKGSFGEDTVSVLETNIDDMNPQNFEYIFEKLFKEGALDAYATPVQMKKSRPAVLLTVLSRPGDVRRLSSVIFAETTTIGVRIYEAGRLKLDRKLSSVKTKYGRVNVKISRGPDGIFTSSPEYDECAKIARTKNIPLKSIYDEAKRLVKI